MDLSEDKSADLLIIAFSYEDILTLKNKSTGMKTTCSIKANFDSNIEIWMPYFTYILMLYFFLIM